MGILNPNLKVTLQTQEYDPSVTVNNSPIDSLSEVFTCELRKRQVYVVPAEVVVGVPGTITVDLGSDGFTANDFLLVRVLTPGKAVGVAINGASTPFTLSVAPPLASAAGGWMAGNMQVSTIQLTNSDSAPVEVLVAAYQRKAGT